MKEVEALALAKNILVSPDVKENAIKRFQSLPFEATSSMHSDFKAKKKNTELESLTGYVVRECAKLNLEALTYNRMYEKLK